MTMQITDEMVDKVISTYRMRLTEQDSYRAAMRTALAVLNHAGDGPGLPCSLEDRPLGLRDVVGFESQPEAPSVSRRGEPAPVIKEAEVIAERIRTALAVTGKDAEVRFILDQDAGEALAYLLRLVPQIRAATIEECARVIRNYPGGGSQEVDVIKFNIEQQVRALRERT